MKILLLEDNSDIRDVVRRAFENSGEQIYSVESENEALIKMQEVKFDVVILDWMLGYENGIRILKTIRAKSDVPVIMLTVKADKKSIIDAIDVGADDYLTKPFSIKELLVRTKKLFEREKSVRFHGTKIIHKNLELDLKNHAVRFNGESLNLTKSEYQILKILLLKKGRLVPREKIISSFSSGSKGSDSVLNMHLVNLRKKINGCIEIKTIPGKGYIIK